MQALKVVPVIYTFDTFKDFDDVKKNYTEECFVPLTLEGHIYAIPTVMAYNVLFY